MSEVWKDIEGYEGLYQVSNWGRVKSLKFGKERILKPEKNRNGYLVVNLYKNGKRKHFKIHRLVAEAFVSNPDNLPCVNHADEDKTNNFYGNLEFCSYQYNNNFGTRNERASKTKTNGKHSKPVQGLNPKTGKVVVEFPSVMEAERNGYYQGAVSACCRGERKTHHGLFWQYK